MSAEQEVERALSDYGFCPANGWDVHVAYTSAYEISAPCRMSITAIEPRLGAARLGMAVQGDDIAYGIIGFNGEAWTGSVRRGVDRQGKATNRNQGRK